MKYLFLLPLFLISFIASSQDLSLDLKSLSFRKDLSLSQRLKLPQLPIKHRKKQLVLESQEEFDSLFSIYFKNKEAPIIDFANYRLAYLSVCGQCLVFCEHLYGSCHRNACHYESAWYLQLREAPVLVSFEQLPVYYCQNSKYKQGIVDSDSAYQLNWSACADLDSIEVDFSKELLLFRSLLGDCHVSYRHEVLLSHGMKTLTWKVYKVWGGCRAGSVKNFGIKVAKPPQGYQIKFIEVEVD